MAEQDLDLLEVKLARVELGELGVCVGRARLERRHGERRWVSGLRERGIGEERCPHWVPAARVVRFVSW